MHGRGLWDHVFDVFSGDLLNHLHKVVAGPVQCLDEGSVTTEAIGPGHCEIVGEVISSYREVRGRLIFPFLSEVDSILTDKRILRALRDIKASSANH